MHLIHCPTARGGTTRGRIVAQLVFCSFQNFLETLNKLSVLQFLFRQMKRFQDSPFGYKVSHEMYQFNRALLHSCQSTLYIYKALACHFLDTLECHNLCQAG